MGSRIAEIQRQLSRDFDRTLRSFLENAGSDEDKDFLDAMLFTLRRATDLVSSNLHQFSLADDDEKMATSIGRTQYLVVILSIHSLSNTPPYIITNMGREVYFQIQGLSLLQFERVTKEFADRGSKFHQQMLESKVMEIMGAILSVPQDEKLEINLKMPRKEFLPRLLQDNPLYLDAAIANKFKQQAEDVNRQWLVKLEEVENAGMAEEAASASSREKSHPCSHASSTSNRNILDQEPRILNYLSRLALQDKDAKRFHFAHDIPQKKLSNALACRSYYATKPPNQAYLLVDNTVFEGGSDGLLITDEVISFKEMFVSSIDYAYTKGGNGNFAVQGATIRRHDQVCIRFSQISASAVQMLVWALNQFFADRFDWHVEMALRGHVESQFILSASCHDKPGEELRWLTLAAENGHVNAQHNLGMHYFYKNPPLAFQWFTKAAQQGSTNAERNLLSDVFKQFH